MVVQVPVRRRNAVVAASDADVRGDPADVVSGRRQRTDDVGRQHDGRRQLVAAPRDDDVTTGSSPTAVRHDEQQLRRQSVEVVEQVGERLTRVYTWTLYVSK